MQNVNGSPALSSSKSHGFRILVAPGCFSSFEIIPVLLLLLLSHTLFIILLFLERAMALFYIRVGAEVVGVSEMETLYQPRPPISTTLLVDKPRFASLSTPNSYAHLDSNILSARLSASTFYIVHTRPVSLSRPSWPWCYKHHPSESAHCCSEFKAQRHCRSIDENIARVNRDLQISDQRKGRVGNMTG